MRVHKYSIGDYRYNYHFSNGMKTIEWVNEPPAGILLLDRSGNRLQLESVSETGRLNCSAPAEGIKKAFDPSELYLAH